MKGSKARTKTFFKVNQPNLVNFYQTQGKNSKKVKTQKTKEALKRYREISHMLERIQMEANKLGQEYEKKHKAKHD